MNREIKMIEINNKEINLENQLKFKPLFKFFYQNEDLFSITEYNNDYYILPILLEFLYSNNKKVYRLFKEFYNLIDNTIRDHEYSNNFLLYIHVDVEDDYISYLDESLLVGELDKDLLIEDKNYIINTKFEFCVLYYTKVSVLTVYITNSNIYNFEEFIKTYINLTSNKKQAENEINICKDIIFKWKMSLLNKNKFYC